MYTDLLDSERSDFNVGVCFGSENRLKYYNNNNNNIIV